MSALLWLKWTCWTRPELSDIDRNFAMKKLPEFEPLEAQELHDIWEQGYRRRPVLPKLSDGHKADLVDLQR
jgi:hypothetical protein